MTNLEEILELRDEINQSITFKETAWRGRNRGKWSKLWSAFDNLEDALEAVNDFSRTTKFSTLNLYGLLQAFIIQQDSLKHIAEALGIPGANIKKTYPELFILRNIRNETTGHPSETKISKDQSKYEKGTITYTTISRESTVDTLHYGVWSSTGFQHKSFKISNLLEKQSSLVHQEISRIREYISSVENRHKLSHSGTSLSELFKNTNYFIEKLWSFERVRVYSQICLEQLEVIYTKFKDETRNKYSIESITEEGVHIPGVVVVIQHLEKIFPRIKRMILLEENTDPLDLDVYVESLSNHFNELEGMAKEIDRVFSPEGTINSHKL